GGMDSWQHFLISKYAPQYPELFLDQWNKPVFTIISAWFCQGQIDQLVYMNIFAITLGALFFSFALKSYGYKNSWVIIPFIVFMPELFLNSISGLTEPLALLMIGIFIWLWSKSNHKSALILASFLPFIRTEGFVLLGAVFILIIFEKKSKYLPWLLIGSLVMNFIGYFITSKPFWIITENPYWKHEINGTFDPGNGSLFYFVNLARPMFGLILVSIGILGFIWIVFDWFRLKKMSPIYVFAVSSFVLYFLAHSAIYYLGILGSHGLTRPMALIAPFIAIISYYPINTILINNGHRFRILSFTFITILVVYNGYKETKFPFPWKLKAIAIPMDVTQINFTKAGNWLKVKGLENRCIVHQSPFFNCKFNKNPYDVKSSYYIWSIDQNNDWSRDSTIIIWDGFSAKREGNMPLEWLTNNPRFEELLFIEGTEKPSDDAHRFDIHIFEKKPASLNSK
ncbi:MAG: hypothetical protein IT245_07230, partial [Bacteroidia bacterium]|nr:hypothetical protein [Bacteroidia bacterium]